VTAVSLGTSTSLYIVVSCLETSVLEQLATWQGHARPVFFIRGKTEAPKTHSRVGVLGEGATTHFPPAIGVWGSAVNSPSGVPKGFPLFSALRMVSPDTIMLLVVD